MRIRCIQLAVLMAACVAASARADLLKYNVPGTQVVFILQGTVKDVVPGGTIIFRHANPQFGTLYFSLKHAKYHKVPTTRDQFDRMLKKAKGNPDEVLQAGVWALKKGLLKEFHEAVDELDDQHEMVQKVIELRRLMDAPIEDSSQQERELRALVNRADMKVALSPHFILLHDTSNTPAEGRRKARAQERLDLLERVYESFLLFFYPRADDLVDVPKERLKVVLFNDIQDYREFSTDLSPSLTSASGFWDPRHNTSVFYDHSTDEWFQILQKLAADWQKEAARLQGLKPLPPTTKEVSRFANTLAVLVDVAQENQDITVVSHEATHQMAGNTGLLPRDVLIPSWVHEGLATYFEAPGEATWAGIGAVNEQRLEWYRELAKDEEHSNMDFTIGDQVFDRATNRQAVLHAYGQAWALTHFLLEVRCDRCIDLYRRLGQAPRDVELSADFLTRLFSEVVEQDRTALDREWRAYMLRLKTDVELILGPGEE